MYEGLKMKNGKKLSVRLRTRVFLVKNYISLSAKTAKIKGKRLSNTHWKLGGVGLLPGLLFDLNIGEIERDRDLERDLERERDRDLDRDRDLQIQREMDRMLNLCGENGFDAKRGHLQHDIQTKFSQTCIQGYTSFQLEL